MAVVTLLVRRGNHAAHNVSTLWTRDVPLEGTPDVGDGLMLFGGEQDPEHDYLAYVKRRYWHHSGALGIELQDIVYRPSEEFDAGWWDLNVRHRDHPDYYDRVPVLWRTSDDEHGTLADLLTSSGWEPS